MAEDPLCTHTPGRFAGSPLITIPKVEYGRQAVTEIVWDDDARDRMKQIPAFVRGMVVKAVESYCVKNGIARVSTLHLDEIRSKMPTAKLFGH
jgi:hypothetical protein